MLTDEQIDNIEHNLAHSYPSSWLDGKYVAVLKKVHNEIPRLIKDLRKEREENKRLNDKMTCGRCGKTPDRVFHFCEVRFRDGYGDLRYSNIAIRFDRIML